MLRTCDCGSGVSWFSNELIGSLLISIVWRDALVMLLVLCVYLYVCNCVLITGNLCPFVAVTTTDPMM